MPFLRYNNLMSGRTSSPKILHVLYHSLPPQSGYAFRSHNILKSPIQEGLASSGAHCSSAGKALSVSPRKQSTDSSIIGLGQCRRGVGLFDTERRLMSVLIRRIREVVEIEKPASTPCPFATVQRYSRASGGA